MVVSGKAEEMGEEQEFPRSAATSQGDVPEWTKRQLPSIVIDRPIFLPLGRPWTVSLTIFPEF